MRRIIVLGVAVLRFFGPGAAASQDLSSYESLKAPRLTTMNRQKMIVVEAKGDPNIVGKDAFGLLFKTFFSLKGVQMAASPADYWTIIRYPIKRLERPQQIFTCS